MSDTRTDQTAVRLVLVDDHEGIREILSDILGSNPDIEVVGQAGTGAALLQLCAEQNPDIILLDLMLPDMNGLDCIRSIRRSLPGARILIFSGNANPILISRAVELGVQGFIEKTAKYSELIEAVRRIATGGTCFGRTIKPALMQIQNSPFPLGSADQLSPRERTILAGIASGKSSKEIAGELGLSLFTVNNHRRRIKNKTGLHGTPELTLHALNLGLIEDGGRLIPARPAMASAGGR